ncbi:hypothetical protein SAMN05443572_107398 [Myxococcus fulvus]|uniref:Uncharacterized protein n=1 Tax=Myxococcus fulvus TaxID=33 RepID=A0A511TDK0_MYXFU|nr:hypothetical protein [Myxococcus fulvus]AKF86104.1 hypothetical protein MFUL124B02_21400 [Myxococcus fulvus 124B02]GEN12241.1 hypothetical protein MFU01_72780 [Myxococcus fulvus]SEU27170.1 hypothetical protein SAMN05443572_107398 [Myxococcus fulvus]
MNDIHSLRTHLALNGRMRLEFHAALSRFFKEQGVPLDERILDSATLATEEELMARSLAAASPTPSAQTYAAPYAMSAYAAYPSYWGWAPAWYAYPYASYYLASGR